MVKKKKKKAKKRTRHTAKQNTKKRFHEIEKVEKLGKDHMHCTTKK